MPRRAQPPLALVLAPSPSNPLALALFLALSMSTNNWEASSSSGSRLTSGQTINTDGAWELYRYGLLAPPDCRIPKEWRLSDGGLVVPPIPRTVEQVRRYIA